MRLLGQQTLYFFTKRFYTQQKAQKHKDAQAKCKNANKGISDFFLLMFLSAFFIFIRCKRFVLFVPVKFLKKKSKIVFMTSLTLLLLLRCSQKNCK